MQCFSMCCHGAEDTTQGTTIVATPTLPEKSPPAQDSPVTEEALAKAPVNDGEEGTQKEGKQCEEFEVPIDKEPNGPVGLDIGLRENDSAIVKGVPTGPVTIWNANVEDYFKIREGDKIVQVNDVRGPSAVLLEELHRSKPSTRLTLRMQRREEVRVQFPVGQGLIGLDLNTNRSRESLIVRNVNDGVVKAWNDKNEAESMKVGDRIVEVNGTRGEPKELLEKLRFASHLDLVFVRFS